MFARYRIKHRTYYRYSESVAICQNQLRMMPREAVHKFSRVECHHAEPRIIPEPDIVEQHEDYFGNQVYTFAIESLHRELDVTINSEVTVTYDPWPADVQAAAWEQIVESIKQGTDDQWFSVQEYCYGSPRIRLDKRFADYAAESFTKGRSIVEATAELTDRINREFKYDTTATEVNTPTEEAFELKAGVCQDFAHIQIACLRSLGLACKYVSGYLRTEPKEGQKRLVGADESHAWVRVYMGPQFGWIDYDPTNACRCDTNHIPFCVGRDYSDVSPMRGVVLGGGKTQLRVGVDVEQLATG
jgi:transglutaminase-like putative cysteine protease